MKQAAERDHPGQGLVTTPPAFDRHRLWWLQYVAGGVVVGGGTLGHRGAEMEISMDSHRDVEKEDHSGVTEGDGRK